MLPPRLASKVSLVLNAAGVGDFSAVRDALLTGALGAGGPADWSATLRELCDAQIFPSAVDLVAIRAAYVDADTGASAAGGWVAADVAEQALVPRGDLMPLAGGRDRGAKKRVRVARDVDLECNRRMGGVEQVDGSQDVILADVPIWRNRHSNVVCALRQLEGVKRCKSWATRRWYSRGHCVQVTKSASILKS